MVMKAITLSEKPSSKEFPVCKLFEEGIKSYSFLKNAIKKN